MERTAALSRTEEGGSRQEGRQQVPVWRSGGRIITEWTSGSSTRNGMAIAVREIPACVAYKGTRKAPQKVGKKR